VKTEVEKAYASIQRTARVRGFRPGKAPRSVLAHVYGGRVHADVAQKLIDSTLNQALADKQIQPLSQPAIAPTELKPDDSFSYKARFEVRPEIAKVEWQGLAVNRPASEVTDAMIDAELTRLRHEHSTLQAPEPERPAKKGDTVRIAFTLEVDGKLKDPKEQEIETEVGSGQVFKDIDQALVDAKLGETKDVSVPFPEGHANPELRGKAGVFHVTVKEIKERVFPEIDDELAKDCGSDSLDALKASLREKVGGELKRKQSDVVAEQLVVELCKANPIPVPPSLVNQQAQITEREIVTAARRGGQRMDVNDDLRARVRADAEIKVRAGLLMAEIAKEKQVKVTEEDIERGYTELAEQSGKNVAKVKAEYRDPKKREMLLAMILEDKILDLLEGAAKVTEGPAPKAEAEKPAEG
jgi:trigger factor